MNLQDCFDKGYLKKIDPDIELSEKELKESEYDLKSAQTAFDNQDYKWCIVKCYYSMFHAAKFLLYKIGYKEKRHVAVIIVLEELNKEGKLESQYVHDYKAAMVSREEADYQYSYSEDTAKYDLQIAKEFLIKFKEVVKNV